MFPPPAGVSDSDWEARPPAVRGLLEQLINRVAQLEEQKGRRPAAVALMPQHSDHQRAQLAMKDIRTRSEGGTAPSKQRYF